MKYRYESLKSLREMAKLLELRKKFKILYSTIKWVHSIVEVNVPAEVILAKWRFPGDISL